MSRGDPRSRDTAKAGAGRPAPRPASPFVLERLLREAFLQAGRLDLPAVEELEADRERWEASRAASLRELPREGAQELAYQAMEADDADRTAALVSEALVLDAACVDALTLKALLTAEDDDDLLAQLEHTARVAEDELGEEFFAEFIGDCFAEVMARPYLRVLRQLAEAQWHAGRRFDAVATLENLLELDEDDHQGHALVLLSHYLEMGEVCRSRDLLEDYSLGNEALYRWAEALVDFLEGKQREADVALAAAKQLNALAAPYLTGEKETPPYLEPWCEPSSTNEAVVIAQVLAPAWAAHSAARLWLLAAEDDESVAP